MDDGRRGEAAATPTGASRANRLWGSLAVRVVGMSSLWAIAAFLVIGGLISSLYERTALSGFEAVVRAQLFNLVNAVTVDKDGVLRGVPDLGDLAYSQPLSGWYWEVLPASANTTGRLSSFSLGRARIADMPESEAPFDMQYRRDYRVPGLDGETLYVEEAEVVLDSDNHAARFRVMGNASTLDADIAAFNRQLTLYLGLFGLGSTVINALAILYGLRPLSVVQRALASVRTGENERLEGRFPTEIQPLAAEMNALIDSNRRIVERARTQVGNLAHALKTPVAVLLNEARATGGEKGRVLREQGERMQAHVQHYLDRARIAAGGESAIARTPVKPVVERLVRVVRKLNPTFTVDTRIVPLADRIVFAGEQQDLEEMLGNLLENAAKYGRSRIVLSLAAKDAGLFAVSVSDDGPGLTAEEIAEATQRGRRFDESVPGSGLGLSIVAETVLQYRGDFRLEGSEFGGLRAELILPRSLDAPIS